MNSSEIKFELTDNEIKYKLIPFMKHHPELWDSRNINYQNQITNNAQWSKLGSFINVPEHIIKEKWNNLVATYTKDLMKLRIKKHPGPLLGYMQQLEFMRSSLEESIDAIEFVRPKRLGSKSTEKDDWEKHMTGEYKHTVTIQKTNSIKNRFKNNERLIALLFSKPNATKVATNAIEIDSGSKNYESNNISISIKNQKTTSNPQNEAGAIEQDSVSPDSNYTVTCEESNVAQNLHNYSRRPEQNPMELDPDERFVEIDENLAEKQMNEENVRVKSSLLRGLLTGTYRRSVETNYPKLEQEEDDGQNELGISSTTKNSVVEDMDHPVVDEFMDATESQSNFGNQPLAEEAVDVTPGDDIGVARNDMVIIPGDNMNVIAGGDVGLIADDMGVTAGDNIGGGNVGLIADDTAVTAGNNARFSARDDIGGIVEDAADINPGVEMREFENQASNGSENSVASLTVHFGRVEVGEENQCEGEISAETTEKAQKRRQKNPKLLQIRRKIKSRACGREPYTKDDLRFFKSLLPFMQDIPPIQKLNLRSEIHDLIRKELIRKKGKCIKSHKF